MNENDRKRLLQDIHRIFIQILGYLNEMEQIESRLRNEILETNKITTEKLDSD